MTSLFEPGSGIRAAAGSQGPAASGQPNLLPVRWCCTNCVEVPATLYRAVPSVRLRGGVGGVAMAEKISEDLSGRRQGNAMAGSQTETPRDGQSLHRDRTQAGFERQAHATYERQAARGGDHPQHRWDGAKLHDHLDLNACSQKGAIDELTDGAPWFEANERLPFEVMDCNRAPGQVVVDSGHQHDFVDAQLADVETSGRHGERDQTEFELVGADVEGYLATPALFHVEANARMQGLELGDSCRQQERRDRGAATHPDRPALEAEVLGDVLAEFVVAGGDAAASVDRLPAQIREFDPVATPHEQFGAQLGLELLEAPDSAD